jgi:hypothetical protein
LRKLVSPKVIAAASLAASVQSKARKKVASEAFSRIGRSDHDRKQRAIRQVQAEAAQA